MIDNDVIILDSILEQGKKEKDNLMSDNDFFEIFAFEQLLKDFDLSYDELISGKTGAGDDGGIDGFFFLINNELIEEEIDPDNYKKKPILDLFLIQAKRKVTFSEDVFEKIITTIQDLFDFTKNMKTLSQFYNSNIIEKATIFKNSYLSLAAKHPQLRIHFYYASKGDKNKIHVKIKEDKTEILRDSINKFFTGCAVEIDFFGARDLIDLSRTEKTYTLQLKFIKPFLSKGQDNYLVLSSIEDYFRFITDENGNLRRYIFDANVRDYQGNIEVNKDIQKTLNSEEELDFWWLNNGITIISSMASIAGNTLTLDDVFIVNGLQTTTCIYDYILTKQNGVETFERKDRERSILVKIIITSKSEARDKIIKATNFQTAIPPASFKASDRIQRDIEDYFKKHDLYYDRRKNYYKNIGKPIQKIISIPFMAQALMAIVLQEPDNARGRPTTLIKRDSDYARVFDEKLNPSVYLLCAKLVRRIENYLKNEIQGVSYQEKSNLKFHICMAAMIKKLESKKYDATNLENLNAEDFTDDLIKEATLDTIDIAEKLIDKTDWSLDRIAKSKEFVEELKKNLAINKKI